MFCAHCGLKLDDEARFCPSCGTKVTQQLAPPPASGFGGAHGSTVLPLLGEQVAFPGTLPLYIELRSAFSELAEEQAGEFYDEFYSKYQNMDRFIQQFPKDFAAIFRQVTDHMQALFAEIDIYGVTPEELAPHLDKYCSRTAKLLREIQGQYQAILEHQEDMRAYRNMRKDSRGRLVGGGFGLQGAAKGIITAGAVNATTGMLHSLGNALGNMGSAISAANAKEQLFNSGIGYQLKQALYDDILGAHLAAIDLISARTGHKIVKFTADGEARAEQIQAQLEQSAIPPDKQPAALAQLLRACPFRRKYYVLAVRLFPDRLDDMRTFATFFHFDLDEIYSAMRRLADPAVQILLEYREELDSLLLDELDYAPEEIEPLTTDLEDMLLYLGELFDWAGEDGFCFLPGEDDKGAAKLQGARSAYAHFAGEQPLILYDATLGRSGKDGFLVTDRSVYIRQSSKTVVLPLVKAIEDIHQEENSSNQCQYLYFGETGVHLLHTGEMAENDILEEFMEFALSLILFLRTFVPREEGLWPAISAYQRLPSPKQEAQEADSHQTQPRQTAGVCYCFECGAENDAGDRYCCECGTELI